MDEPCIGYFQFAKTCEDLKETFPFLRTKAEEQVFGEDDNEQSSSQHSLSKYILTRKTNHVADSLTTFLKTALLQTVANLDTYAKGMLEEANAAVQLLLKELSKEDQTNGLSDWRLVEQALISDLSLEFCSSKHLVCTEGQDGIYPSASRCEPLISLLELIIDRYKPTLHLGFSENDDTHNYEAKLPKKNCVQIIKHLSDVVWALMYAIKGSELTAAKEILKDFPYYACDMIMPATRDSMDDETSADYNIFEYFVQLGRNIRASILPIDYSLYLNVHELCSFLALIWTRILGFHIYDFVTKHWPFHGEPDFLQSRRFWEWEKSELKAIVKKSQLPVSNSDKTVVEGRPYQTFISADKQLRETCASWLRLRHRRHRRNKMTPSQRPEITKDDNARTIAILGILAEFECFLKRVLHEALKRINDALPDGEKYVKDEREIQLQLLDLTISYKDFEDTFMQVFKEGKGVLKCVLNAAILWGGGVWLYLEPVERNKKSLLYRGKFPNTEAVRHLLNFMLSLQRCLAFAQPRKVATTLKRFPRDRGSVIFPTEASPIAENSVVEDWRKSDKNVFAYFVIVAEKIRDGELEIGEDLCLAVMEVCRSLAFIITKAMGCYLYNRILKISRKVHPKSEFLSHGNFWLWHTSKLKAIKIDCDAVWDDDGADEDEDVEKKQLTVCNIKTGNRFGVLQLPDEESLESLESLEFHPDIGRCLYQT